MNSPAEDVKDMLDSTSVGAGVGTFATDLFVGLEPDSPDACVTVYDTGGYPPDPDPALELQEPTVQVRVRGARGGYASSWTKIAAACAALHGTHNETWNGARYLQIQQQGDPLFLGFDERDRPLWTANFRVLRTPSS